MNKQETAKLLRLAAAFDQRTTGKEDVEAWFLALRDIPWDSSTQEAVAAFYGAGQGDERRWLQPHHVRAIRRRVRQERLDRVTLPPPNPVEGVPSPLEFRALVRAVGDGLITNQAEADAYTAWGGSLHVSYLQERFPELSRIKPLALTARPVGELIAGFHAAREGLREARRGPSETLELPPGPRVPPPDVPCPWRACKASAGEPCFDVNGDPREPHPSRTAAQNNT